MIKYWVTHYFLMRPARRTNARRSNKLIDLGKRARRGLAITGIAAGILWGGTKGKKNPSIRQLHDGINRGEVSAMKWLDPEFSVSDSAVVRRFQDDLNKGFSKGEEPKVLLILGAISRFGANQEGINKSIARQKECSDVITSLKQKIKSKKTSRSKVEEFEVDVKIAEAGLRTYKKVEKILRLVKDNPELLSFFEHLSQQPHLATKLELLFASEMYPDAEMPIIQ